MEDEHVHQVYEAIAPHFSSTRYKPWPRVDKYMRSLPSGSIGADVGCGNGKYFMYPHVYVLGMDRSQGLTEISSGRASMLKCADAMVADALEPPVRKVDFALSIAVVHHFSTRERRVKAIGALLNILNNKRSSTALVYVWALEQQGSRRGFAPGMDQDVMVPWVSKLDGKTYNRFYHLYKQGELEEDVLSAGGEVVESGYEKDNWWAVIRNLG